MGKRNIYDWISRIDINIGNSFNLFGANKLPEIAKSLGTATKEFKDHK